MKKLQKDYTTPEQSERLIKLGVPADSANKAYWTNSDNQTIYIDIPDYTTYTEFAASIKRVFGQDYFPAWSDARLMHIYFLCGTFTRGGTTLNVCAFDFEDICEYLCCLFETACRCNYMDFSKLEE